MATLNVIARPYAQAAFAFAESANDLPAWGQWLFETSKPLEQPQLAAILGNSRVLPTQWLSLLTDLGKPHLNEARENFLRILSENQRLPALPEIALLFKELEAKAKQEMEVEVITAVPMEDTQLKSLTAKLTQSLKSQVNLRCTVDEHILGGAIVRAGDKVIDGSLRGQLKRLLEFAIR